MQEQTQQQLLSELEKLRDEALKRKKISLSIATTNYYDGKMVAFYRAMELVKSITTNRSSQEPKIKE